MRSAATLKPTHGAALSDISRQVDWYGENYRQRTGTRSVGKPQKQRAVPGLDGGFCRTRVIHKQNVKDEMSELLELALAFGEWAKRPVTFATNKR